MHAEKYSLSQNVGFAWFCVFRIFDALLLEMKSGEHFSLVCLILGQKLCWAWRLRHMAGIDSKPLPYNSRPNMSCSSPESSPVWFSLFLFLSVCLSLSLCRVHHQNRLQHDSLSSCFSQSVCLFMSCSSPESSPAWFSLSLFLSVCLSLDTGTS